MAKLRPDPPTLSVKAVDPGWTAEGVDCGVNAFLRHQDSAEERSGCGLPGWSSSGDAEGDRGVEDAAGRGHNRVQSDLIGLFQKKHQPLNLNVSGRKRKTSSDSLPPKHQPYPSKNK
uniref:Uncharacterized protein n=1 Tax=Arundo donax TaxID=35708 RepID=A0A0A9GIW7_ARUDO